MERTQIKVTIDSDVETRKGVHADNFSITTRGDSARLDFFLSDIQTEDGETRGVLSSRIFMDIGNLPELRDALDEVVKKAMAAKDGAANGR